MIKRLFIIGLLLIFCGCSCEMRLKCKTDDNCPSDMICGENKICIYPDENQIRDVSINDTMDVVDINQNDILTDNAADIEANDIPDIKDIETDIEVSDIPDITDTETDVEISDIEDTIDIADVKDVSDIADIKDVNLDDVMDIGDIGDAGYISIDDFYKDAHLVFRVETNATIDLNKAKSVVSGDLNNGYLTWTKKFADYLIGKGEVIPDIDIKFAINSSGVFYAGVYSDNISKSLSTLHNFRFEELNVRTGNLIDKGENYQESVNDLRDCGLYQIIFAEYKRLKDNQSIINGINADDEFYYKVKNVEILNNISKNIFILFSKISIRDPSIYDAWELFNRRWNPCPNNGSGSCSSVRSFSLSYKNEIFSSIYLGVTNDNGESSYIKIDGTTEITLTNWGVKAKILVDKFPTNFEIGGSKTWSQNGPYLSAIFVADDIIINSYSCSPDQGITRNPPPVKIPLYPGWNRVIHFYDYFEDDTNWQDKWEIHSGNNTMNVTQENGDLKIHIPRGDTNYGRLKFKNYSKIPNVKYMEYLAQITANGSGGNYLLFMNTINDRIDIGVDTDDVPYINFKLFLNGQDAGNQNIESSSPYLKKLLNMTVRYDGENYKAYFNNVNKGNPISYKEIFENLVLEFSAQQWKSGDNDTIVDYFEALIIQNW